MSELRAVIIAGGLGTRFRNVSKNIPKCLALISGTPVLNIQIELLIKNNIKYIYISSGYLTEQVQNYIDNSEKYRNIVTTIPDKWPAGSGGCLQFLPKMNQPVLVLFGDIVLQVNIDLFIKFHNKQRGLATIALQKNDHPHESDIIEINSDHRCISIHRKPHVTSHIPPGFMVGGLFIIEPSILNKSLQFFQDKADLVQDILAPEIEKGSALYGYVTEEFMDDIGTPERFKRINNEWKDKKG